MTGTGTLLDPYIVSNITDLNNIRNQTDEYTYYELASDIDVSSLGHWTPIGTRITAEFYASIDGKGYTIRNMHITSSEFSDGIFLGFLGYAFKVAVTSSYAYHLKNITFENCSINYEHPGWNEPVLVSKKIVNAGIAAGLAMESTEYTASVMENVHIKSCSIFVTNTNLIMNDSPSHISGSFGEIYVGGLVGRCGGTTVSSCSVNNSSIITDVRMAQNPSANENYVGGLVGKDLYSSKYNVVKNSTIQGAGWVPNLSTYTYDTASSKNGIGGYTGEINTSLYTYDSYIYNCIISGTTNVAGFTPTLKLDEDAIGSLGFTDPLSRIYTYVNFGNTPLSQSFIFGQTYLKQGTYDSKDLYYQSESVSFTQSAAAIIDITGSTIAQMKNSASYDNWDFANVWGINPTIQNGYPYLLAESFTSSLMANIQGKISSSLDIAMQDVTMSFHTASGTGITYTTYTDVNGIYTQSVADIWSGSLVPTGSGYEFFYGLNASGSVSFVTSSSDRTQNWTGVKNFSSGSGQSDSPYIIMDYEDMNNVRYRTGSGAPGFSYKLGADINLSYFTNWLPIPDESSSIFRGQFNGDNKTISNMTITSIPTEVNAASKYIGLFGQIYPRGSYQNVNFNSCSINLLNPFKFSTGTSPKYIGTLCGRYNAFHSGLNDLRGINVKNSTVKYISQAGAGSGVVPIKIGGIVGDTRDAQVVISMYSCSVEDSTIHLEALTGSIEAYVGGLGTLASGQFAYNPAIYFSYVKNSYIFGRAANLYMGAMASIDAVAENSYCLNNTVSSSNSASAFIYYGRYLTPKMNKCYVAKTNWGNTPIAYRVPFVMNNAGWPSVTAGYNYYESGTVETLNPTIVGVTASLEADMANSASLSTYVNWDFDYIWESVAATQSGYPYLLREPYTPRIKGYISNSLGIPIENIPVYFTNGRNTEYTNTNGIFRSFYSGSWSGSLSASLSNYQFFTAFNNSSSVNFPTAIGNASYQAVAVKNFISGSGAYTNPYIILDYEDMHNVRYRTGSNIFANTTHYQLGVDELDLSYFPSWCPIPSSTLTFYGTLRGNNCTIKNMNLNTGSTDKLNSTENIGLFGRVRTPNSGTIFLFSDLYFDSCSIFFDGGIQGGGANRNMGFLAGYNSSHNDIKNIHVNNSNFYIIFTNSSAGTSQTYGGIIGDYSSVGGAFLVSSCSVENTNFHFSSSVSLGGTYQGGLFGETDSDMTVRYCYSKNNNFYMRAIHPIVPYVGGMIGGSSGIFYDCYVLSCSFSGSASTTAFYAVPFASAINGGARNYVALINYTNFHVSRSRAFTAQDVATYGYNYYLSGSYPMSGTFAGVGVTGSTETQMLDSASYVTWDFQNIWLQESDKNYAYPYLGYQTFPIAASGLTLHYDSRIGYISASNTWTDLSGQGVDASTKNTYPTGSHLYFGNTFGPSSASIASNQFLVSRSFGIEIWTAPTASVGKKVLFSTVSGTFPIIDAYTNGSTVYIGFQSGSSEAMRYISASNSLNSNKFNHIAFTVTGLTYRIWVNGQFYQSRVSARLPEWSGGTIGIADTIRTGQYAGYIDTFKIWNGPAVNMTTVNNYYSGKNYWTSLPQLEIFDTGSNVDPGIPSEEF